MHAHLPAELRLHRHRHRPQARRRPLRRRQGHLGRPGRPAQVRRAEGRTADQAGEGRLRGVLRGTGPGRPGRGTRPEGLQAGDHQRPDLRAKLRAANSPTPASCARKPPASSWKSTKVPESRWHRHSCLCSHSSTGRNAVPPLRLCDFHTLIPSVIHGLTPLDRHDPRYSTRSQPGTDRARDRTDPRARLQAPRQRGESRTIIGVIGDETKLQAQNLSAIPGVEQVLPIMKPFKLASREFHKADQRRVRRRK